MTTKTILDIVMFLNKRVKKMTLLIGFVAGWFCHTYKKEIRNKILDSFRNNDEK